MNTILLATLICVPMVCFPGVILIVSGVKQRKKNVLKAETERERTTGTIVEYKPQRVHSRRTYRTVWTPVVTYQVGGQEYRLATDWLADREKYPVGTPMELLYDADHPERAHLEADEVFTDNGKTAVRIGIIWIVVGILLVETVIFLTASDSGGSFLERYTVLGKLFGKRTEQKQEVKSDYVTKKLSDFQVEIERYTGMDTALKIPSFLDGGVVSGIASGAFSRAVTLESLVVPGSVGEIEAGSFAACARLRDVTLNEGIYAVGMYAFKTCDALQDVTLPASLTSIGRDAFPQDCAATFHVVAGSYAEAYCQKQGYAVELIEADTAA